MSPIRHPRVTQASRDSRHLAVRFPSVPARALPCPSPGGEKEVAGSGLRSVPARRRRQRPAAGDRGRAFTIRLRCVARRRRVINAALIAAGLTISCSSPPTTSVRQGATLARCVPSESATRNRARFVIINYENDIFFYSFGQMVVGIGCLRSWLVVMTPHRGGGGGLCNGSFANASPSKNRLKRSAYR